MPAQWLSLVDYSNKYKISISTLRRKIKLDDIPFQLSQGKYYIVDEALESIGTAQGSQLELAKDDVANIGLEKSDNVTTKTEILRNSIPDGEPVIVAANRMLDEIKKAYTLILQEKDEQIRQLRDEISDLKTLVRVLEGENERIKKEKSELYFD